MPLINKENFLNKFNINKDEFDKAGLEWKDLEAIYADYNHQLNTGDYELIAQIVSNKLNSIPEVHSTKYRLKDPEHLIEKIIRKRIENIDEIIDLSNYQDKITDLIGVRVLHLFKEDWDNIHTFICNSMVIITPTIAYYRNGDSPDYLAHFKTNNCEIIEHKFGYRSVHYLAKSSLFKKQYIAEIQVRTIFEEGWSEVDHKLKYPYIKDNSILERFLSILNRFAGGADEMCSFIKFLQSETNRKDREILKLKEEVDQLAIDDSKKQDMNKHIDVISKILFDGKKMNEAIRTMSDALDRLNISGTYDTLTRINNTLYVNLLPSTKKDQPEDVSNKEHNKND